MSIIFIINNLSMYTTIFYIILWLFIFEFIFTKYISYLNTLNWSDKIPKELEKIYDEKKYSKSMKYEKVRYDFSNILSIVSFFIIYFILIFWGFWFFYDFVSSYSSNEIVTTLYFFWIIFILNLIITIPFSYYSTFVIEQKFGFNKMTKKIFFIDLIKSFFLTVIIWWLILSLITYIYLQTWSNFWIYTWLFITFISIFIMMFYSNLIVPLFNKQTPLKKWKLRDEIEKFLKKSMI